MLWRPAPPALDQQHRARTLWLSAPLAPSQTGARLLWHLVFSGAESVAPSHSGARCSPALGHFSARVLARLVLLTFFCLPTRLLVY